MTSFLAKLAATLLGSLENNNNPRSTSVANVQNENNKIHDNQFENRNDLTVFKLPKGVTEIGNCAFKNCKNLKKLIFESVPLIIGNSAFEGCESLTDVELPKGVCQVGNYAFSKCTGLIHFKFPESMCGSEIGRSVFYDCPLLESVELPSRLTGNFDSVFNNCRNLKSVTLPEGITSIDSWTFAHCELLTSINIPSSVKTIGHMAFCGCSSLKELYIPDSVKVIAAMNTFADCTSLETIRLPKGVNIKRTFNDKDDADAIGSAFYGCTSLKKLIIGEHSYEVYGKLNDYLMAKLLAGESIEPVSDSSVYTLNPSSNNDTDLDGERDEAEDERIVNQVIEKIKRDTLKSTLHIKLTDTAPGLFDSKAGGLPYLPENGEIPHDEKGNPLKMLAQINCKDLIALPDFPHKGILQFWVGIDDVHGLFTGGGSRVVYYEEIDYSVSEQDIRKRTESLPQPDYFPVYGEYGFSFKLTEEPMSAQDNHFEDIFVSCFNSILPNKPIKELYDLGDAVCERVWTTFSGFGHKMGGYPAFTQYDPRKEDDELSVLLFQLDSEYGNGKTKVMWGDAGICGFFCTQSELRERDFSKVFYTWDCG